MKRTVFLLFCLLMASSLFAQKALVKLTFTGTLNGSHVNLDSLHVKNLTQGGDTVLHWPDTTLSFIFSGVGIPEVGSFKDGFAITQIQRTQSDGMTRICLSLPEAGEVEFRFLGIGGNETGQQTRHFEAGNHLFSISGGERMFLLSARWKGQSKTLKVINAADAATGKPELQYEGNSGLSMHPKSVTAANSFAFFLGDSLQITGFAGGLQSMILDNPSASHNYIIPFTSSTPCQGISSFLYGGQTYNTVEIGTQCWMRENLNIGDQVSSVYGSTVHSDLANNGIIEKYCYQNMASNCNIFGGLYDWAEMMQYGNTPGAQGICATGWHIPTESEWQILIDYMGGSTVAGGPAKEAGNTSWNAPNTGATNLSGFTAKGAGHRFANGNFGDLGGYGEFWSSEENSSGVGKFRYLVNTNATFSSYNYSKLYGFSVRCLKN